MTTSPPQPWKYPTFSQSLIILFSQCHQIRPQPNYSVFAICEWKKISNILLHSVRISASLGNRACSSPNLNIASMLVFQFSLDYRCIHLHYMNILSVQPPLSFWSSSPSLWSYSHSEANQSTNSSTSALYSSSCPSLMHPTMQTQSCTESLAMTKCIHLFSSNFGRFVLWHAGQRRT